MHWKLKALIQNVVARLPSPLSHAVYYRMQRRFGGLANANPRQTVRAALEIAAAIRENGLQLQDAVFLEVGTGRRIVLPLMMWLLGAKRVLTVDVHRYLKAELVAMDLAYFRAHRVELVEALSGHDVRWNRVEQLLHFSLETHGLESLLKTCQIDYLAPADAARLPVAAGAVDFHVSTNVFEHVPPAELAAILREAARVLSPSGLVVHRIDHSDHFSHSDPSLSPINFLRYNEAQWSRLAGNRYMYMNRLQVDDFERLFADSGHEVLALAAQPDRDVLRELQECPPPLDAHFAKKQLETLATMNSLIVSRPRIGQPVTLADRAA